MEIKNRSGTVLYSSDKETLKETLKEAVENKTDLRHANLRHADLFNANLSHANLSHANLRYADLRYANLRDTDLFNADLRHANLRHADLFNANLSHANLSHANLRYADLRYANLRDTDLFNADLRHANLRHAKNIPEHVHAKTTIVPEGEIVGWKKCEDNVLVKLQIPKSARRSNATGRKCRAEKAKVLQVIGPGKAYSRHDQNFIYEKGKTVHCHEWDEDRWNECSGGIHFFITRHEAEEF